MRNSNTFLKDMWKKLCWHWNYPLRMILSKQDTLKRRKIIPSMSLDLLILFFSEFLLKITFLRFWQKTANFRLSKYVLLKNVPKRPAKLMQSIFLLSALTDSLDLQNDRIWVKNRPQNLHFSENGVLRGKSVKKISPP